jgi:hypothetical protein
MFTVVSILIVAIVLAMAMAMPIAERHPCRPEHCCQSETQAIFPQHSTLLSFPSKDTGTRECEQVTDGHDLLRLSDHFAAAAFFGVRLELRPHLQAKE